ncbi:1-aminocyclopropane-1-carboxylate oxidase homolog 4-like [Vitis riparia]|uniref:1-aminocyclopropane-1-carboxylate oxidase homolog 4-like n=1 Tax=Vitis riparia TaxID=96939 RepID=UPI00155AA401|nr:1-aminocyclopropane-1-carboxylate oxidase homolog 4-like [Vitis riparia]
MSISLASNFFTLSSHIRTRSKKEKAQPTTAVTLMMAANGDIHYDRAKEVKQFDESKIGVKGLVDSGITTIPRIFIHPTETISDLKSSNPSGSHSIPVISLSGDRSSVVDQIRRASAEFGFFQIINHGISTDVLDRAVAAIRAFNEQPTEVKAQYYRRDIGTGVAFSTNFDLYHSKAASWRDTLQVRLGPTPAEFDKMPEVCRREVMEWDREVVRLGEALMGMMCEGLGLDAGRLKELTCLEGRIMASHYYPYCPEPELTMGLTSHTDPGVLTVVLQNQVGGLQVKHDGAWLDLNPVPGALVINVGDMLQVMSNDEYKSVEHRVAGNPCREARVSIAVFFNPGDRDSLFGPLPELISAEKPAVYKSFTFNEFMTRFFTKELDGKSLINFFKLPH